MTLKVDDLKKEREALMKQKKELTLKLKVAQKTKKEAEIESEGAKLHRHRRRDCHEGEGKINRGREEKKIASLEAKSPRAKIVKVCQ